MLLHHIQTFLNLVPFRLRDDIGAFRKLHLAYRHGTVGAVDDHIHLGLIGIIGTGVRQDAGDAQFVLNLLQMSEAQPLESQAAPSGAGVGCQKVHPCPLVGILPAFQELEIKQGEAVEQLVDVGHLADGLEFPDKATLLKSYEFPRQAATVALLGTFADLIACKARFLLRKCLDNTHIIL